MVETVVRVTKGAVGIAPDGEAELKIAKRQMWGKAQACHLGACGNFEKGGGGVVLDGADRGEVDDCAIGKRCLGQPAVEQGLAQTVHAGIEPFASHLDHLAVERGIGTRGISDSR